MGGEKTKHVIATKEKQEIIESVRLHSKDTGSADAQIAVLTARINELGSHLQKHQKDHSSRRGLLRMVVRRRRLLEYLGRTDPERYQKILKTLNLRK